MYLYLLIIMNRSTCHRTFSNFTNMALGKHTEICSVQPKKKYICSIELQVWQLQVSITRCRHGMGPPFSFTNHILLYKWLHQNSILLILPIMGLLHCWFQFNVSLFICLLILYTVGFRTRVTKFNNFQEYLLFTGLLLLHLISSL